MRAAFPIALVLSLPIAASAAPISFNFEGGRYTVTQYSIDAVPVLGEARGAYTTEYRASGSLTLGAALPANALIRISERGATFQDIHTGADLGTLTDVVAFGFDDGVNSYGIEDVGGFDLWTDAAGVIADWDILLIDLSAPNFEQLTMSSQTGIAAEYLSELLTDCADPFGCALPFGFEEASASTSDVGVWSMTPMAPALAAFAVIPAVPLPGGLPLLAGGGLAMLYVSRKKS